MVPSFRHTLTNELVNCLNYVKKYERKIDKKIEITPENAEKYLSGGKYNPASTDK